MSESGWVRAIGPSVEYEGGEVPVARSLPWALVIGAFRGVGVILAAAAALVLPFVAYGVVEGWRTTGRTVGTPLGAVELGAVEITVGLVVAAGLPLWLSVRLPSPTSGDGPIRPVPTLTRLTAETVGAVAIAAAVWWYGVRVPATTATLLAGVVGAGLGLVYVTVVWPLLDAVGRALQEASPLAPYSDNPVKPRGLAQLPVVLPYAVALVTATDVTLAATVGAVAAVLGRRTYVDVVVPLRARREVGAVDPADVRV